VILRFMSCRRRSARGMDLPLSGHFEVGQFGASVMATSCWARVHAKPRSSTVRSVHLAPSSPPDCQSSHRQGVDALSVVEARLGVRPVPLQLPCGVAAGVDMIDGETRSASTAGKVDLELHPVSRNRKVTDRTRDTDGRVLPTCDREGESEASPRGWHCGRADRGRLRPFVRTPFGADAHDVARRHAVGKEIPSQMPEGTTPGASTRNPMEGKLIIPRGSPMPGLRSSHVGQQSDQ